MLQSITRWNFHYKQCRFTSQADNCNLPTLQAIIALDTKVRELIPVHNVMKAPSRYWIA